MNRSTPRVSVAIPLYNEEQNVPALLHRLRAVFDALPGEAHEVVFVDDGSRDRTVELLTTAAAEDDRVVVISLSRNFGHQAAISAALDHARGDVVVVMDGDLQDPPEVIPLFLAEHAQGYDVVYATRAQRKEGWLLRLCYFLFYRVVARLAEVHLPLDAGDFGLMSRRVVDEIRRSPERQRYLRGLRTWVGFRQKGVVVERQQRHLGKSKYTPGKLLKLGFDGIFAFSTVPLRAATVIGALAMAASSLFAAYSLFAKLFLDAAPRGFTATIVVLTFLSGVHLLFLGIIGEYIGRIYEEVKARPLYVVDRVIRIQPISEMVPSVAGERWRATAERR